MDRYSGLHRLASTWMPRNYQLGSEFPHEGFVQAALERYFADLGFGVDVDGHADLVCAHSGSGERWLVEAKGVTSSVGLDFRTGLGQLVQRMTNGSVKYGVGIPDTKQFLAQCRLVSDWTRMRLGLYWFVVAEDGSVRRYGPDEAL